MDKAIWLLSVPKKILDIFKAYLYLRSKILGSLVGHKLLSFWEIRPTPFLAVSYVRPLVYAFSFEGLNQGLTIADRNPCRAIQRSK